MQDTVEVYYIDCNLDIAGLCYGDSSYFYWTGNQSDSMSISMTEVDTSFASYSFSILFSEAGNKSLDYSIYRNGFSKSRTTYFEIVDVPTDYLNDSLRSCVFENITPKFDVSLYENTWFWGSIQRSSARADSSGWYTLELSKDYCKSRDSVYFILDECFCDVYVPDGFSPNNDGLNDVFRPTADCDIRDLKMSIYTRWGQKLMDSDSAQWDGRFKGSDCQLGAYLWIITYTSPSGVRHNLKGVVSLLR
jgi:gliding motility-associated-like protein